jgi:hypothetical protein
MKLISFLFIFLTFHANLVYTICPKGTIQGIDTKNCYKFYGTPNDFWSASANCQLNNGNLASVTNAFVNSFISGKKQLVSQLGFLPSTPQKAIPITRFTNARIF